MDYDVEQLIIQTVREHGFQESGNKPELFFKEVDKSNTVFCDCRNGAPTFYGYVDKRDPMEPALVERFSTRVRQALAAIGMDSLKHFDEDVKKCPHCGGILDE